MRINGIETVMDGYEYVKPGRYYLIRVVYITQRCREVYHLQSEPGRTNQSLEQRLDGWLGETNNVSRYAEGAVEVYADQRGRMRCRRIDAEALLDEDNVEIEEQASGAH